MPVFKPIEYKEPAPGEGLYKTAEETEWAMALLAEKIKKRKKEMASSPEQIKLKQEKQVKVLKKIAGDKKYLLEIKLTEGEDVTYVFQKLYDQIELIRDANFVDEEAVNKAQLARYYLQNFIIFGLYFKLPAEEKKNNG